MGLMDAIVVGSLDLDAYGHDISAIYLPLLHVLSEFDPNWTGPANTQWNTSEPNSNCWTRPMWRCPIWQFEHAYGFHDLMEYLMEKGAKDDILNKDGLTCYEGLSSDAVDAI
ncbi:Aste57867_22599 [Aphanomyces stellatus]|uniref:Aste57867_22599 protein n=1 Tax=Aphanomyces stellatus TaxID=120398 RepID=A0A485LKN8_9STRA|nr:hypothetical protein As57867_022529 [Aphanomyces stellatus]VFT99256.1 Aste57867_22599 [Aphanomyces stellatus]